ncbi:3,4-dihydroxy-2-butanone-4-phosphate synthase [Rhodococcus sp. NJ-530]|uniref:3,4-dihydroxy-2-butanone-4-phosphate synthase n=1 Tax=Rhodococcus sp. NJ-530 TaxID=2490853 RepID=UPI001F14DA2C|nr:3,4-dihydroxy-2-butanone-4-phosphate synthase [Rhodococcus sp. NJ-530]
MSTSNSTDATRAVEACVAELRRGRPVIVVDDETRENEADLVMAAQSVEADDVAFFLQHTSGFLCVSMTGRRTDHLDLPQMVENSADPLGTAFTVSVDAAQGITTGISAGDRAHTIKLLGAPSTNTTHLVRPGHIMPLRACPGGVLERRGHTEAAVDLCAAAGLEPVGLICELISADRRTMLARDDVPAFADRYRLAVITIAQLVEYRLRTSQLERGASCRLPTEHGIFTATAYRSTHGHEHLALVYGDISTHQPLVRVHSECLTGDTLGSMRCDCGEQLNSAMAQIAASGGGILIYVGGHEGRGIGLFDKIAAYHLQDTDGLDTVDANLHLGKPVDSREYGDAAAILLDLCTPRIRLMTNNPAKRRGWRQRESTLSM